MSSNKSIDLNKETKKGASWTTIASLVSALSQLALTIILSRYLDHADFGLMAVALFVINFSQIFVDIGISNAIIHRQNITKKELDSLYWLNILMGVIIFLLINLSKGYIAEFYNSTNLVSVLSVISCTFLIQPLGAQFNVLLRKNLLFKSLAKRSIFAQLSGLVAGIILAIFGFGVYALVYSTLINTVVGTFLVILEGLKFHKPAFYFSYQNVKTYMSFGLYQLGEKLMNYLNSDVDTLIIGKFVGVDSLGVYSLAKNFISKPYQVINPILTKIGFPLMAKVQNDNHILQRFYKGIVTILSYINFPLHLFVFAFPELVVSMVFGDKWDQAIIPLRILALCYLLRSTMNPIGSLQLAKGKANYGFYWNLVQFIVLPIVMYLSSFWGVIGICIGITLFQLIMFSVIGKLMVEKLCGLKIKEYYAIFIKPFIYCLISYLITKLSLQIIEFDSKIIDFLYTGMVFISFYGVIVYIRDRKMLKKVLL